VESKPGTQLLYQDRMIITENTYHT
jgi:hypothetical protein